MMTTQTDILWDKGSAYDLFISLWILHRPDEFGLRPSWAAGVRSRLPADLRDFLEQAQICVKVPLHWIYRLPEPKDTAAALRALEALPPAQRLPALVFDEREQAAEDGYRMFMLSLEGRHRLTANLEEQIREFHQKSKKISREEIRMLFSAWSDRTAFGKGLLRALRAYFEGFFREEEARILPVQEKGLAEARRLAQEKDLLPLLEDLSSGVRMDSIAEVSRVVLVPSFWSSPFVFFDALDEETEILVFGSRPQDITLVPGELVPEALLNALKALADPTRLRILRSLIDDPRTPSELAKLLRLRAPTVIHHLHNLRLAGLVRVTVSGKGERRYAARLDGIESTMESLHFFLLGE
jgi:DNA-binding transcriptional ArsR family regulator